jgi:hypothetical protein
MLRLSLAALSLVAWLALGGPAAAQPVIVQDDEGRSIRFDVRSAGADADWYAGVLRKAAHSDEIERVTIRIVDWHELDETCGRSAAGCYENEGGRGLIVVPAGRSSSIAHTLVHEYGHHIDWSRRHGGLREPNGTPLWWTARGMERLVDLVSVARSYRLGWVRSIAEIFAEDYAYTNLGGRYRITWLKPPDAAVKQAILADLGLAVPPELVSRPPAVKPVVITRSGTLGPSAYDRVGFGLLGPNRRVTVTASLTGRRTGSSALVTVTCGNRTAEQTLTAGRAFVTFGFPRIGPAQCEAELTGSGTADYRFTVRLSVPPVT